MKTKLIAIIALLVLIPILASAQVSSNYWKYISNVLSPNVVNLLNFRIPYLASTGSPCVVVDSDGDFATSTCGSGSSQWVTSGSNIHYPTGNVGIGTTTPYAKLSVVGEVVARNFTATSSSATSSFAGGATVAGQLLVGTTNSAYKAQVNGNVGITGNQASPVVAFGNFGGSNYSGVYEPDGGQFYSGYDIGANRFFYGSTGPGTGLTISGSDNISNFSGNVGVGTSSPYAPLSVVGQAVASYITATSTTATSTFSHAVRSTCFTTNGTTCITGGGIGGSNTEVQFNDSGTFAGDSSMTWDKTGNTLTLRGDTSPLIIEGNSYGPLDGITISGNIDPVQGGVATALGINVAPTFAPSADGKNFWGYLAVPTATGTKNISDFGGALLSPNTTNSAGFTYSGTINNMFGAWSLPAVRSGNVNGLSHIIIDTPLMVGGGAVGNLIGVDIRDQNVGTSSNFAIKTRSGKVSFGDNVGVGTTSPYAPLSVVGQVVGSYFTATTTTASTLPYASSTALTVSDTLYVDSLNGPLQANAGRVSATTSVGVLYGGTGLTAAPSYGQIPVGNASGGYTLTSTSSLNISGGGSGTVNSGTAGQGAYYAGTGAAVSGTNLIGIDAGNNRVGINTQAPQTPFHVSVDGVAVATNMYSATSDSLLLSNGGASFARLLTSSNTGSTAPGLFLMKSRGTVDTPLDVVSGDTLGSLSVQGWANSNRRLSSRILATVGDTVTGSIVPGKLELQTANTAGTLVTGLTVSPRQFVGIGSGTTTPGVELAVAGNAIVDNNVRASNFAATSSVASTFPYASSTALTVSGSTYLGSATGALQSTSGLVSAGVTSPTYGGTGQNFSSANGWVNISAGTFTASTSPTVNTFTSTSTTATSTVNGGLRVGFGGGCLEIPSGCVTAVSPVIQYVTSTSTTLTVNPGRQVYVLYNPPTGVLSLSVDFSDTPSNGDVINIAFNVTVVSASWVDAVNSSPGSFAQGDHVGYIYSSGWGGWMRID